MVRGEELSMRRKRRREPGLKKEGRDGRREEKVLVTKSNGKEERPTRPGEELLNPKKSDKTFSKQKILNILLNSANLCHIKVFQNSQYLIAVKPLRGRLSSGNLLKSTQSEFEEKTIDPEGNCLKNKQEIALTYFCMSYILWK